MIVQCVKNVENAEKSVMIRKVRYKNQVFNVVNEMFCDYTISAAPLIFHPVTSPMVKCN